MQNFQDNFETRKRSFISAFSTYMTVSLKQFLTKKLVSPKAGKVGHF